MKMTRYIILIIFSLLWLQSCIISPKPNINFFSDSGRDFKGVKFESINVPMFLTKPFIKKALRENGEDKEMIDLVKKVSKIKVLTVKNGSQEMVSDYANYLHGNHYEDWATIIHGGDQVNIRVKQSGEVIRNMLITVNSDKKLVFVDVRGKFTVDDISKLISSASDK